MDHKHLEHLLKVLRDGGVARYSDQQIQLELYADREVVRRDDKPETVIDMMGDDFYADLLGSDPKFNGEK